MHRIILLGKRDAHSLAVGGIPEYRIGRCQVSQSSIHFEPRLPASIAQPVTLGLARTLLPLHRTSWQWKTRRGLWRLRPALLKHSPFIDYLDLFPQLGDQLVAEWSVLDTHDALTDYYKHLRTREEIEACLRSCGLIDLEVSCGGNGVEARARMPAVRAGLANTA